MSIQQPTDIKTAIYPYGASHIVIDFERLVKLLNKDQLLILNGCLAAALLENENGENDGLENT